MSERNKLIWDAFTFSLGSTSAKMPYLAAQAIAHDRINNALDERIRRAQEDQPVTAKEPITSWGRFWLRARSRGAAERPLTAKT